ncbi:Os02g0548500 [Oryza sativa Japonica Group]|uniref:Os02g0548500 protein n=1 Tax=Oryza sativa subsp. japonica TaxID=39947 RepID=A0A0P0VK80_ORYSJ|nr:serine/arginine repetitive matrix protein 2 [Oryza sativa Japonica Group]BAS79142.1 Os02g0548500 [Oryza sativa Japonica Group]
MPSRCDRSARPLSSESPEGSLPRPLQPLSLVGSSSRQPSPAGPPMLLVGSPPGPLSLVSSPPRPLSPALLRGRCCRRCFRRLHLARRQGLRAPPYRRRRLVRRRVPPGSRRRLVRRRAPPARRRRFPRCRPRSRRRRRRTCRQRHQTCPCRSRRPLRRLCRPLGSLPCRQWGRLACPRLPTEAVVAVEVVTASPPSSPSLPEAVAAVAFFDELDALAAGEEVPAVFWPPRSPPKLPSLASIPTANTERSSSAAQRPSMVDGPVMGEGAPTSPSPTSVSASAAGDEAPAMAAAIGHESGPTVGEGAAWLAAVAVPPSPVADGAEILFDMPVGGEEILFDMPILALDLDGQPMACSLPPSVVQNAALRAILASCCKPLCPAPHTPPAPMAPTVAAVGVVPKRSKWIAAHIALAGPCHMITRA